jgi:hypothetical protein
MAPAVNTQVINAGTSNTLTFISNNITGMTINSSGQVLIGDTNNYAGSTLYVNNSITTNYSGSVSMRYNTSGSTNNYWKGMTGVNLASGSARGLHIFNYDADSNPGILFWINNPGLSTSGSTPAMTLDQNGNLGLGVTPSAWQSYKAIQTSSGAILSYSTNDFRFTSNALRTGGNWQYINTAPAVMYLLDSSGGTHQWYNAVSGTAGNSATFTQAMTLDNNGNLLVGYTSTAIGSPSNNIIVRQTQALPFAGVNMSGSTWVNLATLYTASGGCALTIDIVGNENGSVNVYYARYTAVYSGSSGWGLAGPFDAASINNGYAIPNVRISGNTLQVQANNGISTGRICCYLTYIVGSQ